MGSSIIKKSGINLSYLLYPVVFVIFCLIAEMTNFIYLGFGVFPKYIIFDLAIILFGAGLIFVLPKRWMKLTVFYFFLGLQIVLNCVNVTLNNVFGDILSLDMLNLGGEAVSAFSFEFLDFVNIILNLLILLLSVLVIKNMDKILNKKLEFGSKKKIALFVLCFLTLWGTCGAFLATGRSSLSEVDASSDLYIVESDVYLWDSLFLKTEAYKKFGTYGFYLKSIENLAFDNPDDTMMDNLKMYVNSGEGYKNDTKYSGVAKDDNLIVIMLESFEWFAIDPIYTPTLYKLRTQDGVSLEGFCGRNKTNVSEDISLLGSMPKNSMMIEYYNGNGLLTPYSLPNLFKENSENSVANFYHGYLENFYNRNVVNKAIGFDNVICLDSTTVPNKSSVFGQWVKDSDFITANLDTFIPTGDEKFFSFYTTIGTHGSYDAELESYKEYYDYFDEHFNEYADYLLTTDYVLPTNEADFRHLRNYKSQAMDTDRMVKILLDRLEETGKIDNTTIVMFADHNCYYHDTTNAVKGIVKSDFSNIKLYNIPFMIYNNDLVPEQKLEFCNTYDIYPTICDLFGFEYNEKLAQGYSVFSNLLDNSVFVSFLNGIYNADYYTNNVLDVVELRQGLSDSDLLKFQLNVVNFYLKQQKIEDIYKLNYFGKINEQ